MTNQVDPRHPHQLDGRDEAPVLDAEGRCLVCSRDYLDELKVENTDLRARLEAADNTITDLTEERDMQKAETAEALLQERIAREYAAECRDDMTAALDKRDAAESRVGVLTAALRALVRELTPGTASDSPAALAVAVEQARALVEGSTPTPADRIDALTELASRYDWTLVANPDRTPQPIHRAVAQAILTVVEGEG